MHRADSGRETYAECVLQVRVCPVLTGQKFDDI
jgi:hypothetical protein